VEQVEAVYLELFEEAKGVAAEPSLETLEVLLYLGTMWSEVDRVVFS